MMGEPIEAVRTGIQTLITALRQDPYALETCFLSVITFNTNAQQLVPLTGLTTFQQPDLEASGVTALGAALRELCACRDREVSRGSAEERGDWRPLVFIMTDGMPTDDWEAGLREFQARKWGVTVACAAGPDCETSLLQKISETVVKLDTADSAKYAAFFKWVSASISTASASVGTGVNLEKGSDLPPPPPEINIVST